MMAISHVTSRLTYITLRLSNLIGFVITTDTSYAITIKILRSEADGRNGDV